MKNPPCPESTECRLTTFPVFWTASFGELRIPWHGAYIYLTYLYEMKITIPWRYTGDQHHDHKSPQSLQLIDEHCYTKTGLMIFAVVIPKESLASISPTKPSVGLTYS